MKILSHESFLYRHHSNKMPIVTLTASGLIFCVGAIRLLQINENVRIYVAQDDNEGLIIKTDTDKSAQSFPLSKCGPCFALRNSVLWSQLFPDYTKVKRKFILKESEEKGWYNLKLIEQSEGN